VLGFLFTPLTKFQKFYLFRDSLFILRGPVIDALAGRAGELYKAIL